MTRIKALSRSRLVLVALVWCQMCVSPGLADEPGASSPLPKNLSPRTSLSPDQQAEVLKQKFGAPMGTFDSFFSFLYAACDVCIHTNTSSVNKTTLLPVFPKTYAPSLAEAFENIARQTHSSMNYNAKTDYWVFDPPAMPLPFSLETAAGWKAVDRGLYVAYIPDIAPVGMDVYMMGRYTDTKVKVNDIRNAIAMLFAAKFNPKVGPGDMKTVTVDGVEALFWESPAPSPGVTWRQWSFVKDGQAFLIVSSIDKGNEDKLLPAVEKMVASFKVAKPLPAFQGL